jgi:hypothetical protein
MLVNAYAITKCLHVMEIHRMFKKFGSKVNNVFTELRRWEKFHINGGPQITPKSVVGKCVYWNLYKVMLLINSYSACSKWSPWVHASVCRIRGLHGPGLSLGPGSINNIRVRAGQSSSDNIRVWVRVVQEYFGLSLAIYLQRKSYLYSHATHETIGKYQQSDLALLVLQTRKARGLWTPTGTREKVLY